MISPSSIGAGYKALFVSVDLPVLGNRVSEARMKFSFPSHITFPNIQEGEGDLMAIYGAGYGIIRMSSVSRELADSE